MHNSIEKQECVVDHIYKHTNDTQLFNYILKAYKTSKMLCKNL